jgi:hypothetical protein
MPFFLHCSNAEAADTTIAVCGRLSARGRGARMHEPAAYPLFAPYNRGMARNTTVRRGPNALIERAALAILLALLSAVVTIPAKTQTVSEARPAEFRLVQGRITEISGSVVTLKMPDGYPGATGPHPQFVTAGPTLKVDVSHARFLLPDGEQPDKVPLSVGDRVVMIVSAHGSQATTERHATTTYSASIIERVAQSDKMVTH